MKKIISNAVFNVRQSNGDGKVTKFRLVLRGKKCIYSDLKNHYNVRVKKGWTKEFEDRNKIIRKWY